MILACCCLAWCQMQPNLYSAPPTAAMASATSEMPTVLIMGATCVDRILSVAAYPRQDEKIRTTHTVDMSGGNAANVAAALALLSSSTYARHGESSASSSSSNPAQQQRAAVRVGLLTKVGDDDAAVRLKADLETKGVDCSSRLFVMQPNTTTSITTVIASESEHTRTCLHSPGSCGELTVEEIEHVLSSSEDGDDLFRNVILFHSDTRHTAAAVALAKEARRRGIPISVDVEKDRGLVMEELVAKASIVFGNEDKLQQYAMNQLVNDSDGGGCCSSRPVFCHATADATGAVKLEEEDSERIHRISSFLRHGGDAIQRDKSVVVTRGSKGAYHIKQQKTAPFSTDSCRYNIHSVGTLRDATVVDTTGAGDAFIAGYIMSLVAQNLPFDHCISFDRDSSTSNADDNISDDALCNLTMFRLRFASWVSGRKLGGPGAQGALPSAKDVDECLGVTYASVQEKLALLVGSQRGPNVRME